MRSFLATLSSAITIAACGSPKKPAAEDAAPPAPPVTTSTEVAPAAPTAGDDATQVAQTQDVTDSAREDAAPTVADAAPPSAEPDATAQDAQAAPAPIPLDPLAPGPGALEDRLVAEVGAGKPVAILPWYEGLVAISADGARARLLVPGPVPWALVDDRARVVWFGRPGEVRRGATDEDEQETVDLWLLDLTTEGIEPRRIARGLGDNLEVSVVYPSADGKRSDSVGFGRGHSPSIRVVMDDKRPKLEGDGGIYAEIGLTDASDHLKAVRRAQPDAETRRFLQTLAARGKDRPLEPPAPEQPAPPERLQIPTERCEEADLCGTVTAFTGTPYWLVLVEHSCGDACFVVHNLYDPRSRKWINPGDPDVTSDKPIGEEAYVGQAFIARDGSGFVMDGTLFVWGRPPIAPQTPEDRSSIPRGGGWLRGQWSID